VTEPDVALTDYLLALECAILCVLIARKAPPPLRAWWMIFFASIGAASLFGGTVHGFFLDTSTEGWAVLWHATILAIGIASVATWAIGSYLQLPERAGAVVRRTVVALLIPYAAIVFFVSSRFIVAILMYLPATLFLLVAMIDSYRRTQQRMLMHGITGLTLTFIAAAIQQLRISIHPVYFNHNALYHVVQAIALVLIFLAATATTPRTAVIRSDL
jgi:hypothetical protein